VNRENQFDLSGRVAVMTGASRGLGQYLARALAKAGADLVITSRNADDLKGISERNRNAWPTRACAGTRFTEGIQYPRHGASLVRQ
jgi:NAD(P)-dependent dehydrogenase (short-subunit alcohol dehydrogenase family)